ncbi:hypothetical protein [Delftia deserti]|uniref:Uncharacterized protein n=1 Tax=Delftia deserti TaxID=1651218 RepID=A0ABW5EZ18_9BURK
MLFTVFMKEKAPAAMVAWTDATPLPGTEFIKQNENETSVTTLSFAPTQRFHRGLFMRIDRFGAQTRFGT